MDSTEKIRKKLAYLSSYRGMKELDFVLKGYADAFLPTMSEKDLETFSSLLQLPEQQLYETLWDRVSLPGGAEGLMMAHIQAWMKKNSSQNFSSLLERGGRNEISPIEALEGVVQKVRSREGYRLLVVVREDQGSQWVHNLRFFLGDSPVLWFPAWDCEPYDGLSPHLSLMHQRLHVLEKLLRKESMSLCVVTTPRGLSQRLPPPSFLGGSFSSLKQGQVVIRESFLEFLTHNGYYRVDLVRQEGEYAVRGSLVDLFPVGAAQACRLDFFGETLDSLRSMDVETQRSQDVLEEIRLAPSSEVIFTPATLSLFQERYKSLKEPKEDSFFEAVCQGRRPIGVEAFLPLFYETCPSLGDYVKPHEVLLDPAVKGVFSQQEAILQARYQERVSGKVSSTLGKQKGQKVYWKNQPALPPSLFYLSAAQVEAFLKEQPCSWMSSFSPDSSLSLSSDFFKNPVEGLKDLQRVGKPLLIACHSEKSRAYVQKILEEASVSCHLREQWDGGDPSSLSLGLLQVEKGQILPNFGVITEREILGEKGFSFPSAPRKKKTKLFQTCEFIPGDYVVHEDHGIGQYKGLTLVQVQGNAHDCLEIVYAGGDKLFLPVENIGLLSRYGQEGEGEVFLDRLGSTAWQARKAKVKNRIEEMAVGLLKIAAERQKYEGVLLPLPADYEVFCARFPYIETEDQLRAIEEVEKDFLSGHPMDRVVCGDVGFGKTEVALRAAFIAARQGFQVAVVTPTTLLCRQHVQVFKERFEGLGIKIGQLSRLVSPSEAAQVRAGLASGEIQIVIATHGVLSSRTRWHQLGLMIIDEEHHFGVLQKEFLKSLKSTLHVLTLSATPIPRTLQMALLGVRELSLITTPPLDRLPVHTHVLGNDQEVIEEALRREYLRGGQVFYVSPRIEDLSFLEKQIQAMHPSLKVVVAHGQMPPSQLDQIMVDFYDHKYDVLLSTLIVESGIDVPKANTLIVHRSELLGLAQLYQLRGRVGRGKIQGYAYFTISEDKMTASAQKRLEVIHGLNYLGAGFELASHDLEIRGSGNLIGKEQSGHIREVGVELYQELLEDALAACKGGAPQEERWTPQVTVPGVSIMIPDTYVPDLRLKLSLYHQAGEIKDESSLLRFQEELVDRFGPIPQEAQNFLEILNLKILCYSNGIEKLEAGPKGMSFRFRRDRCSNPLGLALYLNQQGGTGLLKPDHRVVLTRPWDQISQRLAGVKRDLRSLSQALSREN